MERRKGVTILFVEDGRPEARSLRLDYRHLRGAAVFLGLLAVLGLGGFGYLLVRSHQARVLEARVEELVAREAQVEGLARALEEVEAGYENLRSLFAPETFGAAGELWLPPATGRPTGGPTASDGPEYLPTSWPLTERGFVTQTLLEGGSADHPGIDIAVPTGSYIRAAGSGTVWEAGEDPVYGNYLVLDHGQGYRTLYAHASEIFVRAGDEVRRNEVVALSGSSGRSSAPHLHFEILLDGEPVDPLSLVSQP